MLSQAGRNFHNIGIFMKNKVGIVDRPVNESQRRGGASSPSPTTEHGGGAPASSPGGGRGRATFRSRVAKTMRRKAAAKNDGDAERHRASLLLGKQQV